MASRIRSYIIRLFVCLLLCGCAAEPDGATCTASVQCNSQLCYANRCLAPEADDDNDGLTNADEHRIGTHPTSDDTDDDGKADGVEVGADPSAPLDGDGDGKPDAIESQLRDADLDCLPDEIDADDMAPNTDPARLAKDACRSDGVCKGQASHINAACQIGTGILTCVYTNVPGWSAVEACDGVDNDCDGAIDEGHSYQGIAVGQGCVGVGACGTGVVQCRLGRATCSTNPGGKSAEASVEQCNGADDDCDGETDEGFALGDAPVGVPCLGTGECGVGKVVCGDDGVPLCSTDPGAPDAEPSAEQCNGLDDDCDGKTDENIALDGAPVGGACMGRGACGAGTVVCSTKGQAVCSSNPEGTGSKAQPETCNQIDDNCDGKTDEGFAWLGAALGQPCDGTGACGKGTVVCGDSGKATCSTLPDAPGATTTVETCDGADDDCDGLTDEGFVWQGKTLGQPCEGLGICGKGVVQCAASGQVTCSTNGDGSKSQAQPETCNGLDDNCDGVTDNSVPTSAGPACVAKGLCIGASGTPACVSGSWSCTFDAVVGYQGPDETTCDGKDNDCDGLTDEGLPHTWSQAAVPLAGGAPSPRHPNTAATGSSESQFCVAGGRATKVTSTSLGTPSEMWCLTPATQSWRLLARSTGIARIGGALTYVPAGWSGVGSVPRWWLMGGVDATGAAAPSLQIDAATGAVSALKTGPQPLWPMSAAYRVAGTLLHIREGLGEAKSGVRAYDASTGKWTQGPPLPPAVTYVQSTCQDKAGGIWLYGLDGSPEVANPKSVAGSLWHLSAGGKIWAKRPAPPAPIGWAALLAGALICDPAPNQIWIHGASTAASGTPGGYVGIRRFDVLQGSWSVPAIDVTPKIHDGYVARVGSSPIIAWGVGATAASDDVWAVVKGKWTVLNAGPPPAVGARYINTPAGLLRVGGLTVGHALATSPSQPAWRRGSGGWVRLSLPSDASVAARAKPQVIPVSKDEVVIWGGVTSLPAAPTAVALSGPMMPAPGAERLHLLKGTWTSVKTSVAAQLPPVKSGALLQSGEENGQQISWVLGLPAAGGAAKLWRVDGATLATTELWDGTGGGPTAVDGATLMWDAKGDRLVHLAATSGLIAWAYPLGAKPGKGAWTKLVSDVGAASGATVVLGDLNVNDPLVAIVPTDSGTQPGMVSFTTGSKPAITPVKLQPPLWRAPVTSVWTSTGAIVATGPDTNGLPAPDLLLWPRTCAP
ncbi:MAG: hypothetical protein KC502_02865 [Myxococcales bacterium]|nr:hypothetical protein [Myxococcales bacterium]